MKSSRVVNLARRALGKLTCDKTIPRPNLLSVKLFIFLRDNNDGSTNSHYVCRSLLCLSSVLRALRLFSAHICHHVQAGGHENTRLSTRAFYLFWSLHLILHLLHRDAFYHYLLYDVFVASDASGTDVNVAVCLPLWRFLCKNKLLSFFTAAWTHFVFNFPKLVSHGSKKTKQSWNTL